MSIALLLVLPTNEQSFRTRVDAKTSDYLQRFGSDFDLAWKERYAKRVLEPLQFLVQTSEASGVEVYENACLADLSLTTKRHEFVVLFSHWKGAGIVRDDLPEDSILNQNLPMLLALVEDSQIESGLWLKDKFSQLMRDYEKQLANNKKVQVAREVLKIMNDFIATQNVMKERLGGGGIVVKANPFTISTWNRDELDRLFVGLLRPGNRVEFSDGLYAKESVATAVNQSFHGLIDLTTCTSTYLSDYLGRISRGDYQTVQFLEPQDPPHSCLYLERTFQLFSEGLSYREARELAKRDLIAVVQSLADEQQPKRLREKTFLNFWR